jgi:hypothetical protein
MLTSRVLLAIAFAILAAMILLDWNFQTPRFYTPISPSDDVSRLLLFKKTIEVSLSLIVTSIAVIVLVWKRSGKTEKLLAAGALGIVIGFWLHPDLFYLLTH